MQTTGINGVGSPGLAESGWRAGSVSDRSASDPFEYVMQRLLGEVNGQQSAADHAIRELAAGRPVELHNVMLTVSRADLAFRLFLEIRNRLIDAYQEVMRMQV